MNWWMPSIIPAFDPGSRNPDQVRRRREARPLPTASGDPVLGDEHENAPSEQLISRRCPGSLSVRFQGQNPQLPALERGGLISAIVPRPVGRLVSSRKIMAKRRFNALPGFDLTMGFTLFYLSAIVLIPIAGLFLKTLEISWHDFWRLATTERALAAYKLTFGASL